MKFLIALLLMSCHAANPLRDKSETTPAGETMSLTTDLLGVENTGDIILYAVPTIGKVENKLIGGTPSDRADWPASFTTQQGSSRCTGTLIGPKTLQLAAHCVGNGRSASLTSAGKTYVGTCTHSPQYKTDSTADYALCSIGEAVPVKWYEIVLTDSSKVQMGDEIVLAGMGGTQPGSGNGGNDNIFRVGKAPVIRLPSPSSNDIVTKGQSALAFGDSGGAAFWMDSDNVLKVVGINSRGNIKDVSYLSATFTKDGTEFYKDWAKKNNAEICGISQNVTNCRGSNAPQPQSPVPAWCKATYDTIGKCIFGTPRLSLSQQDLCRDETAKIFACQQASELEDE